MKPAMVPTVFIIDDDHGMRQAIQDLVESVGLCAESFATGQDFLNRKRPVDQSCLVLDVRLPQISGLDFQRLLDEMGLQIPIIFITAHGDIPMSVRALKYGIRGFSLEGD
ncbi:response regulator transcription factor [Acidicapsa acidisoli]|uniref:response regulator transcription factor n=1 Tax=Acidicapsa acidisoli TaxID=1615681 RepID=UPI00295ADA19|nr:response regulator [Acidicapsa acidisoli]